MSFTSPAPSQEGAAAPRDNGAVRVTLYEGGEAYRLVLHGQLGAVLVALIELGPAGLSPQEALRRRLGMRLASNVHKLRRLGVNVTTEREPHDGGTHARYVLASVVALDLLDRGQPT
ncbi:winged helix domain-containing protein [Azospirillum sp. ST 5-10]|uniref:winged helix domain-containing protein n=1 Tax=unclassified Azospirillum TaxID=2630922 RepID=UPI003F49BDE0